MKCFKLSLFVLVPLFAQHASAIVVPDAALAARQQNKNGGGKGGNLQTSLTLDPSVIAPGFADGKGKGAGEANSLQSTNNFINFCAGKKITNGAQVTTGSCNPAPMGNIPSTANMPSAKFQSPKNGETIAANKAFTISMAIRGMQTGFFTNAAASYFAAPQQLNGQGQIQGHSHVVIEKLSALDQTTPTDPTKFAFFKGLNAAANKGVLTADVTAGLPAGVYKLSSINSAANHQPVLVPIAQHGSLDDAIYFTVSATGAGGNGNNAGNAGGAAGNPATPPATGNQGGKGGNNGGKNNASSSAPKPAASTPAAGGNGGKGGNQGGNNGAAPKPAASSPAAGGNGGNNGGKNDAAPKPSPKPAAGGNGGNNGGNNGAAPKPATPSPATGGKGGNAAGNNNGAKGGKRNGQDESGRQQKRRFLRDY